METLTQRRIDELPILTEMDEPDFGQSLDWVNNKLFAGSYRGLMRTSWGDVVVFTNADLAALRGHPASTHQPVDVMTEGREREDVDRSGAIRLLEATTFSMLPPSHRPAKQAMMKLFNPKSVVRFADGFVAAVTSLLDQTLDRRNIDFVTDFARPAVAAFWSDVLGLTLDDSRMLVKLAAEVQLAFKVSPTADEMTTANRAGHAYMDLVSAAFGRSARAGHHPILLELVDHHGAMHGPGRADDPFARLGAVLLDGFHTLGAMFSSVVFALVDAGLQPAAPDRHARQFATDAFQEGSRLHPAITVLARRAAADFSYGGVTIPAGTNIQMGWLLGNRDPAVFDDPTAYRLDRPNRSRQYTFGGGFYVCAGRNVVQALSELLLLELTENRVTVELTGPAVWDPGSLMHELSTFPVEIRRA